MAAVALVFDTMFSQGVENRTAVVKIFVKIDNEVFRQR